MLDVLKAHLVRLDDDNRLMEEIARYCFVTGKSRTLEEACLWAKGAGGESPDIFVINCASYFAPVAEKNGNSKAKKTDTRTLLRSLSVIKKSRSSSRIVILLPEDKEHDWELIAGLLKMRIYDFWFFDRFDENDVKKFILTGRNLDEVEKYLSDREKVRNLVASPLKNQRFSSRLKKIYKPYYVKSNVVAFWSDDNSLLAHGTAVLSAIKLARSGFKVALVETVSHIPRLASTLSLGYQYYNTRHVINLFSHQDRDVIKRCLFNSRLLLETCQNPDKLRYLKELPENLFLLPDGINEDNPSFEEMEGCWKELISELARVIIFEKDFNFLIFSCFGKSYFNDIVLNGLAYLKFYTVNMLPSSIVFGLNERKKEKGRIHIIGADKVKYIDDELCDYREEPFLYPPACFNNDFLDFIYTMKWDKISENTHRFIDVLIEKMGVRQEEKDAFAQGLFGFRKLFGGRS